MINSYNPVKSRLMGLRARSWVRVVADKWHLEEGPILRRWWPWRDDGRWV